MKSKAKKIVVLLVLTLLFAGLTTGMVLAETEETNGEAPQDLKTILYMVGAWLFYAILGLIAALVEGNPWDPLKFTKSFLFAIVAAILAIGFQVHPTEIITQYSNMITEVVNMIANSGFGVVLIYFFDKLYRIIMGLVHTVQERTKPPT